MNTIYFDIETSTWFSQPHVARLPRDLQVSAMEFGCAVTWEESNGFCDWAAHQDFESDAVALWHRLVANDVVAGWNITHFDIPIIARAAGKTIGPSFPAVYDLFDIIKSVTGRWYKLDVIAQANLGGRGKTADGLQAAKWLAEGKYTEAIQYCRVDVELERDLGELALTGHPLILPPMGKPGQDTQMILTIDFDERRYTLGGKF